MHSSSETAHRGAALLQLAQGARICAMLRLQRRRLRPRRLQRLEPRRKVAMQVIARVGGTRELRLSGAQLCARFAELRLCGSLLRCMLLCLAAQLVHLRHCSTGKPREGVRQSGSMQL